MTVETFNPKQTTTLETPAKTLAAQEASSAKIEAKAGSKVGFVSLG